MYIFIIRLFYVFFFKGDRFGGALDGAAKTFTQALDKGLSPMQFVNEQKKSGRLIPGIGHRVKSVRNFLAFKVKF